MTKLQNFSDGLALLVSYGLDAEFYAGHDVFHILAPPPEQLATFDRDKLKQLGWYYGDTGNGTTDWYFYT